MEKKKRILFITTKNIDYIRNSQEIRLLREEGKEVSLFYSRGKNYPLRLISLYLRLLFKSMRIYEEVFIGFSPQLILPLFFWKFRGKKVVIDFFISVYDTMVNDRKKIRKGSLPAKWIHWLDAVTLRRADGIVADTRSHGRYFVSEFGADPEKIRVIYLEADKSIYYPRQEEKPEHLKDKFTVLYFGSVLPLQGVDIILKALERLKERKDMHFILIGPLGKKLAPVLSDNIEYISWLPQEKLAEYIGFADLCLAGHFNGEIEKAKRTIPGKTYIYRAMEKPVILGDSPANHELFQEDGKTIYYVPMGDPQALADKIAEICDDRRTDQYHHTSI